jgi:acyl-CoA synthetase (AMP-forming)/AMP-acid ligase II
MSSMDVNLADLFGAVADAMPDRCAVVCDGDRLSYRQLMDRASQLAQHLIAAGLRPDETAGLYMLNSAAYVESLLACMFARLIPVNINYRYTGNELAHLFTAGRLAGLVVDAEHAPLAAAVAAGSPDLRHVLVTGDGGTLAASFPAGITALDYGTAIAAAPAAYPDNGRSGDDKIIIFTGGTTGLPRGVLWRHEDFYFSLLLGGNPTGPPRLTVGGGRRGRARAIGGRLCHHTAVDARRGYPDWLYRAPGRREGHSQP